MTIKTLSPIAVLLLSACAIPASPPAVAPVAPTTLGLAATA